MSRWKAAGIHVGISACVALIGALLIFGLWYPPDYREAAGADQLVVLLICVDVVLGPLLTLVVFKAGKRGMRFDLCVIATLQACAFLYGMSIVVRARPAFIVGEIDRFVMTQANDLTAKDLAKGSKPEFRYAPWTGPRIVGAQLPKAGKARTDLMFSGMAGKDIEDYPAYYVDYSEVAPDLLKRAKPIDVLIGKHPDARGEIEAFLKHHDTLAADAVWLPLNAPKANITMVMDRKTGNPIGTLPLKPW